MRGDVVVTAAAGHWGCGRADGGRQGEVEIWGKRTDAGVRWEWPVRGGIGGSEGGDVRREIGEERGLERLGEVGVWSVETGASLTSGNGGGNGFLEIEIQVWRLMLDPWNWKWERWEWREWWFDK